MRTEEDEQKEQEKKKRKVEREARKAQAEVGPSMPSVIGRPRDSDEVRAAKEARREEERMELEQKEQERLELEKKKADERRAVWQAEIDAEALINPLLPTTAMVLARVR